MIENVGSGRAWVDGDARIQGVQADGITAIGSDRKGVGPIHAGRQREQVASRAKRWERVVARLR